MSDLTTMVLILGGTLVCAMALLYFSLLPGAPRSRTSKRDAAIETTAAMAAANDPDARRE
ncbi:MAG TPA: hypothetical protein VIF39_08030 [Hyphomicrobium sp.]